MYKRIIFSAFLTLAATSALAQNKNCINETLCVGSVVTSYEVAMAAPGVVVGFTQDFLNGETKGTKYTVAIVEVNGKRQNIYPPRLSYVTEAGTCESKTTTHGMKIQRCIGDEVVFQNKKAQVAAFKSTLLVGTDGKVIGPDYMGSPTFVKRFENCGSFFSAEFCDSMEFKNAKGETETVLGIGFQEYTTFLVKVESMPSAMAISYEQLKDRIAQKVSFKKSLKLESTSFSKDEHKDVALKNAKSYVNLQCNQDFLWHGFIDEAQTSYKVGSCRKEFVGPSINHGYVPAHFLTHCQVDVTFVCKDGYMEGREAHKSLGGGGFIKELTK